MFYTSLKLRHSRYNLQLGVVGALKFMPISSELIRSWKRLLLSFNWQKIERRLQIRGIIE
jgi:hypothetical protein